MFPYINEVPVPAAPPCRLPQEGKVEVPILGGLADHETGSPCEGDKSGEPTCGFLGTEKPCRPSREVKGEIAGNSC